MYTGRLVSPLLALVLVISCKDRSAYEDIPRDEPPYLTIVAIPHPASFVEPKDTRSPWPEWTLSTSRHARLQLVIAAHHPDGVEYVAVTATRGPDTLFHVERDLVRGSNSLWEPTASILGTMGLSGQPLLVGVNEPIRVTARSRAPLRPAERTLIVNYTPIDPPEITSYGAYQPILPACGQATVAWTTANATSATLMQVSITDPRQVETVTIDERAIPAYTQHSRANVCMGAIFTLTASNALGSVSRSVLVRVLQDPGFDQNVLCNQWTPPRNHWGDCTMFGIVAPGDSSRRGGSAPTRP